MPPTRRSRFAYAILAVLFIGSFAFQVVLSAEAIQLIWSQGQHFSLKMLTSLDLEFSAHVLTPFACLTLAFYVTAVRIWDGRAWLLLAVLISFSIQSDGSDRHDAVMLWTTPLRHFALAYRSFGLYTFPFWLALFTIYFPERSEWERRNSKAKWLFLVPLAGIACWCAGLRVAANEISAPHLEAARDASGVYFRAALYFSVVFFLVVLTLKLLSAKSADSRRRVRVLLFGIALTLVPLTMLDVIARILHVPEDDLPPWLLIPAFSLVLSFPVTMAYVTVVQRALDVRTVIRQSLQYALARRGVVLLQIVISAIVVIFVAGLAGQTSFFPRLAITAAGIAVILLTGMGANRLGLWIDRQFFREAYDTEQILNRLAESVSSIVELAPLLKTVATRIGEALHVSDIAVFLCEQNFYRPVFSLGNSQSEGAFDDGASTVRELSRRNRPVPVYSDDPRSWAAMVDRGEANLLRGLDAQLLLPLSRKDDLLGFISLGPKASEAPYSTSDLNLLQSVASQTALAVENSRLTSTIATETAEREVINRELAIAREVQQRLFPQTFPPVEGLDYHGTCRPASEVGGDYYDFLDLPNRKLGIAIGDISGKGIPAALLMASLQASLRGQAMAASTGVDCMVANINGLIYAATPGNRYATFFYAQYDPVCRCLSYVNAGHNPPMVLRRQNGSAECMRLETGGPPVGLLPQANYESAQVDLQPGDLMVLFSDGISEAMNSADEEWGEERMMEVLNGLNEQGPEEAARAIFEAADNFAAGAPQHDDMTLVVFRVAE